MKWEVMGIYGGKCPLDIQHEGIKFMENTSPMPRMPTMGGLNQPQIGQIATTRLTTEEREGTKAIHAHKQTKEAQCL